MANATPRNSTSLHPTADSNILDHETHAASHGASVEALPATTTTHAENGESHDPVLQQRLYANYLAAGGHRELVPEPTTDEKDPLNWPLYKKNITFGVIAIAAFMAISSANSHTAGLVIQAEVYHKTPTDLTYSVSSAIAGLMAGPIIFIPLTHVFGTTSMLFWSYVGMLLCSIWSFENNDEGDYVSFVLSRLFVALFASVPQIVGNQVIMDMYFLHQRGRAFAIYGTMFTLGAASGPTFGGFIIQHTRWTWEIEWTIYAHIFVLLLVFLVMEDTSFKRDGSWSPPNYRHWGENRLATLLPGTRAVPGITTKQFGSFYVASFAIFFSPATILAGTFEMINFGWAITVNTLLAIYLQEPPPFGYGFSPQQNAAFTFSIWIGNLAAQAYGLLLNDRIPLRISDHRGGAWAPEYRLHTLWFPGLIIMPIGCGVFGAALEYRLHYMVLALGAFLTSFGSVAAIPIPLNYLVESYQGNPQEVGTALTIYRLLLGLIVPFFVMGWTEQVGVGWMWGMAAFFSIFAFGLIVLLMWKGRAIRRLSLGRVDNDGGEERTLSTHQAAATSHEMHAVDAGTAR